MAAVLAGPAQDRSGRPYPDVAGFMIQVYTASTLARNRHTTDVDPSSRPRPSTRSPLRAPAARSLATLFRESGAAAPAAQYPRPRRPSTLNLQGHLSSLHVAGRCRPLHAYGEVRAQLVAEELAPQARPPSSAALGGRQFNGMGVYTTEWQTITGYKATNRAESPAACIKSHTRARISSIISSAVGSRPVCFLE